MSSQEDQDRLSRKTRMVALVVALTMTIWIVAQFAGSKMGWGMRYASFVDLAALGAFIWCFVVIYQIWRQRRDN